MHTVGRKSFARIREEMKNQNPNIEEPSQLDIFKAICKRNPDQLYKDPADDTSQQIGSSDGADSISRGRNKWPNS